MLHPYFFKSHGVSYDIRGFPIALRAHWILVSRIQMHVNEGTDFVHCLSSFWEERCKQRITMDHPFPNSEGHIYTGCFRLSGNFLVCCIV